MSETKEAKVLGEFETIRIKFEGREEYLEISGNGNVSADYGTHGNNMNLFQATASISDGATYNAGSGWENFQKQSQYLDILIKVNDSGHKVHEEIDEAVKKLKEITYN
jgi:hypothetical protein